MADVIFIHGLLGGAFKTWRQKDPHLSRANISESNSDQYPSIVREQTIAADMLYTKCWPKDWLARDYPHVRIIVVDYDTHLTEWGRPCPYENERFVTWNQNILLAWLL